MMYRPLFVYYHPTIGPQAKSAFEILNDFSEKTVATRLTGLLFDKGMITPDEFLTVLDQHDKYSGLNP